MGMERYQNIADTDTDMRISPYTDTDTDTDTPILARFCSKFQVSNFISMLLSVAWLYSGRVKACIVTWNTTLNDLIDSGKALILYLITENGPGYRLSGHTYK